MRKNSQYISISEYCKANGLKPTKFYETLSQHPDLAKKLKTNAKGERVLDEKAITAAGAILRKENRAKQSRSSVSSAADEINILAAKNEVLRNEMSNLIFCQALTPCIALTALQGVHHLSVIYFFTIFHSSPSIMYWNSDRFSSSITLSKS